MSSCGCWPYLPECVTTMGWTWIWIIWAFFANAKGDPLQSCTLYRGQLACIPREQRSVHKTPKLLPPLIMDSCHTSHAFFPDRRHSWDTALGQCQTTLGLSSQMPTTGWSCTKAWTCPILIRYVKECHHVVMPLPYAATAPPMRACTPLQQGTAQAMTVVHARWDLHGGPRPNMIYA